MKEIKIPLNGGTLRCGEGTKHEYGGYVRLCNSKGTELLYWSADEIGDDPESVIGAIFAAAHELIVL
jgi:hypothetical protein